VTGGDRRDLVTRLDTPSIIGTRVRAARWWLALILTDWAHGLTRRETGDAPVWLLEFAMEHVRAQRVVPERSKQEESAS
jgi:hypothetical protein